MIVTNPQTGFYRFPHYAGRRARMARIRRERIAYQDRLRRQWRRTGHRTTDTQEG